MRRGGANSFGQHLRRLREQRGETLEEVGRRVGLSGGRIGQLERGQDPNPRLSTIVGLSYALNVDAAWLFTLAANDDGQRGPASPRRLDNSESQSEVFPSGARQRVSGRPIRANHRRAAMAERGESAGVENPLHVPVAFSWGAPPR